MENSKIIIGIVFALLFGFINFINLRPAYVSNDSINESLNAVTIHGMPVNFFKNGFDAVEFTYDPTEDEKMKSSLMEPKDDRYEFSILKQKHFNEFFDIINDVSNVQNNKSNEDMQSDFTFYFNKIMNDENEKTAYLYSEKYLSRYENISIDDENQGFANPNKHDLTFLEELSRIFVIDYEFIELSDFDDKLRSKEKFEENNKLKDPNGMGFSLPELYAESIFKYSNVIIVDEIYLLPHFGSYVPNMAIDYPNSVLIKIKDMSPYGRALWNFTIIEKWLMCSDKIPQYSKITSGECISTYKYFKMIQEQKCEGISRFFIHESTDLYVLCMNRFYFDMIELINKDENLKDKANKIYNSLLSNFIKKYIKYETDVGKLIQEYFENAYQY